MKPRLRKLNGFLVFLAFWAVSLVAMGGATLAAFAMLGDPIDSGPGPVGRIIGPSFFFACVATSGEMARRKKAQQQRRTTLPGDDAK